MKTTKLMCLIVLVVFAALAITVRLAAQDKLEHNQKHHHYKLVVLGTLGGPQSFGDPGDGAANINNRGIAVGVADTATPNPNYPNFSQDPLLSHAFRTVNGTIADLGALPGANSSSVSWISVNGLVSGQSLNGTIDPLTGGPAANAVLWKDGHVINLGTLGGYESAAGRVNSRGQVTGFSGNTVPDPYSIMGLGTQTRAFIWQNGVMEDLGTLGGPDAFAPLINERGQIAGISYPNTTPSSNCFWPLTTHLFLWELGKMHDLGTLGGTCILPDDMNDRGQIVGLSTVAGDTEFHAFVWDQGKLTDIGTLGGTYGEATAINEAGEVAGLANTLDSTHAFLWTHGITTDIGVVEGDCASGAFGINSKTQVVGQSFPCDGSAARAFLWEQGQIIDLNVFVPPGVGITLEDVEVINDRGEMFGEGVLDSGDSRAFLLLPCDEDHPGVEGCDYSIMDADTAAKVVSTRAATPSTAASKNNPLMGLRGQPRGRLAHRYPGFPLPQLPALGRCTQSGTTWDCAAGLTPTQLQAATAHPLTVSGPAVTAATPTFSPARGLPPQTVAISTTTPGAIICYQFGQTAPVVTNPGTCPSGTLYSGPVSVTSTNNTLNAIATIPGGTNSAVATAFYTTTKTGCNVPLMGGGYLTFDPSGQAATVHWVTNVPADSLVVYGGANTGTVYGVYNASNPKFPTAFDPSGVTTHSVKVSGLFPGFGQKFDARSQAINGGVPCGTGYYKTLTNLQGKTPVPPTTGSLDYVIGPGNGNTLTSGPLNGHPSTSPDANYPASPTGWGDGPLGGQYVTQGYGLYLRLEIGRLSGAWNVRKGLKITVGCPSCTGGTLPAGMTVAWIGVDCFAGNPCTTTYKNVPDINNGNGAQGFFGGNVDTELATGGVNYDTILTGGGDDFQREIFIGTTGSTPSGTYNVTITGSANNGSGWPTHSTIWPITVVSSSAPFSGVPLTRAKPTSYPKIPQLALYNSNAYTYGAQSCAQDNTNRGTRGFTPNDTVIPYGIAAPLLCCTYSSWFYDGTEAYYNVETMLNTPAYNPSYPKYSGANWSQCRANVRQTYLQQVLDTGKVVISGGGGTGAVGAVGASGTTGVVTNLTLVAGGSGYTSNPTCRIIGDIRDNADPALGPPVGTPATCTATTTGGKVTNLTLTNAGTGYYADPNPNLVYTITNAVWSGGVVTLTVSGTLPAYTRTRAQITVGGVTSSGPGSYNGTPYLSGMTTHTITFPLTRNPGTYANGGTVKFHSANFQNYFELLTFSKGFYRHYLQTGDPDDLSLIAKWLRMDPYLWNGGIVNVGYPQRETAYMLRNYTHAALLGFTRDPSAYSNANVNSPAWFREYALDHELGQVDQICLSQNAEYWENFMAGLQMMELIEYYELANQDPRIPPAIACLAGYMYKTQWEALDPGAFPYDKEAWMVHSSIPNGGNCMSALDMMVAPAYAWLFKYTGNAVDPIGGNTWQVEGDDVFNKAAQFLCTPPLTSGAQGALTFPADSGGKQYSQNYSWGPYYVFWRSAP